MRVLITGGAGFIGSNLADLLLDRGDHVVVLDDLSTGRYENIEHLLGRKAFQFELGTVLNADLVDHLVAAVDVVYHLAAAVGVNLIVQRPLESLITNIRGSEIVLEKAHKHGKATLVTSTSEIYGKNTSDQLSEDDDRILGSPLKSRWSYSEAKAIDEILAYTYWKEKGLKTVIVRLFNTVGPRQTGSYGMVIPRFVHQAIRGEALTIYGDGSQSRCFCYVGEVIRAMVLLMECPESSGRVFNIGGHEELTILELANRVIAITKSTSEIRFVPYDEAYEEGFEDMQRRVPDTSRARDLVGFRPVIPVDDVIRMIADDLRGSGPEIA